MYSLLLHWAFLQLPAKSPFFIFSLRYWLPIEIGERKLSAKMEGVNELFNDLPEFSVAAIDDNSNSPEGHQDSNIEPLSMDSLDNVRVYIKDLKKVRS